MSSFELDPRLSADTYPVLELPLCAVRLMKDANYPWLVLVPRRRDLIELIDLEGDDRAQLMAEIALASEALRAETDCQKLNVAALGNQVSQLHVHVIARNQDDAAWPNPVWGFAPATRYDEGRRDHLISALIDRLSG
ncbi:HIT domain-containing protein [Stappia sp. F7233]|uniref:HIT domain-containing protein n=1 Tax=Stappia albiluteola TaxID=2758565 RepID=A0A839A999_9HYPH|nr:HIT family protein [Stappia albiluteola]MBA5776113.1 HIT domain-containing protein [Stappia albiluteola]